MSDNPIKGRGAQMNTKNKFLKREFVIEHLEGIDEEFVENPKTTYFIDSPKQILNKIVSPDLRGEYSMNPYQGCEHGCIYCYARNTHTYYGFSAGIDFEQKIIVKINSPKVLEEAFDNKNWQPTSVMLAGNTDIYQPAERKYKITRQLLEVFLKYKNPVSIITKNSLILRDIDLLKELSKLNLVHVNISITSLNEETRLKLEPRTATAKQRLKVVQELSSAGIPVNVMIAPIIPSLTCHEIPEIMKQIADAGALSAAYTMVRLNGQIGEIFTDWITKQYPDRAERVLNQIREVHGGSLNDSQFGRRMSGEGKYAEAINMLFKLAKEKYLKGRIYPPLSTEHFKRPEKGQLSIF
ncbi:MAG: PA0069 family radical SAM protein [Opitutaceae bacterium]|nr:PA0069 family radical SAM protein [Cytophagales bacterium]